MLLWIDIVALTQINLAHGRAAGNAVLSRTARCIQSELEAVDTLFRYESDEFVVVLNSTDMAGARRLAQRISRSLREPDLARRLSVYVTVKCVNLPADMGNLSEALAATNELTVDTRDSRIH